LSLSVFLFVQPALQISGLSGWQEQMPSCEKAPETHFPSAAIAGYFAPPSLLPAAPVGNAEAAVVTPAESTPKLMPKSTPNRLP